jgi:hypothetical protein
MSLEGKTPEEINALAALADDVLGKPDTAAVFQRLVKKNNPHVSMPLIELEDRAAARIGQTEAELNKLKAEREQDKAANAANQQYETLRDSGVVGSRTDFNELVKWASENGFMTTDAGLRRAASQRSAELEAAEPTPATLGANGSFSIAAGEDSKRFMDDPRGTANNIATGILDKIVADRKKGGARTH